MAKTQNNLSNSLFIVMSFYYVTSYPIKSIESTAKMTAEYNQKMNKTAHLITTYNNSPVNEYTPLPPPILLHKNNEHRVKRAIDANQGSSWLKFVWRERKYKIPQMFLTNIRNLWAVDPAGGRHLFDPGVPYGTVYLLKTLLLDTLFPRIGKNQ